MTHCSVIWFELEKKKRIREHAMGYSRKNPNRGEVSGYGISRGIKEIACGISRGQLKMTWNFQGWPRKNNVEFPGVFVFGLGISKGSNTILWNIQGLSFVFSGIFRSIVNETFQGRGVEKSISSTPPVWIFSGITQCVYKTQIVPINNSYLAIIFHKHIYSLFSSCF